MKQWNEQEALGAGARAWLADLRLCLAFFSRLPISVGGRDTAADEPRALAEAIRALPLAGLVIGGIGGAVLLLAAAGSLTPLVGAFAALTAIMAVTGALHEDGLADTADSLGGATREDRLEIMRDSRTGAFGASALIVSIGGRAALIAEIAGEGGFVFAALALTAGATLSRTAAMWPAYRLAPARSEGAGHAAGRPSQSGMGTALLLAVAAALALLVWQASLVGLVGALAAVALASLAMTRFAERTYGGHSGDLAGATQQVAEVGFLLALAAAG
jgi:adenosylcobinamide-GDP ribazoletransferase